MSEENILVVTTGGTIDKQYFDALSEYRISDSMIHRLLELGKVRQAFRVEELLRKDSLDLDEGDRDLLARCVAEDPARRIVVTHGTDTMVETARVLALIEGKTIVLTGALSPARFIESDAAFNLGMAFAAAQVAEPGVYIAMNGKVFDAASVRKDREIGAFVDLA